MEKLDLKQALESLRDHKSLGLLWEEFDALRMRGGLGSEEFEKSLQDAAQGLLDVASAIRRALVAVPETSDDDEPEREVDLGPVSDVPNLSGMGRSKAINAVVEWFFANFEDPVHHTPWDGGYVYIWGGPHDAREEIYDAFGPEINEDVVEEAVTRIEEDGLEWAPDSSRLFEKLVGVVD
jgi:hypothetical protein